MHLTGTQAFDLGAITIIIATAYNLAGRAMSLWMSVRSLFMVEMTCSSSLSKIVVAYLHASEPTPSRSRTYGVASAFAASVKAAVWVPFRALAAGKHTLRYKGARIYYKYDASDGATADTKRKIENAGEAAYLHKYEFFRWTVDWEKLLKDAADWHTKNFTKSSRHEVFLVHADRDDHSINRIGGKSRGGVAFTPSSAQEPIGWAADEFSPESMPGGTKMLSLTPELVDAIAEIRVWFKAENWFKEHGVPWTRKYGLAGSPGQGKTTFARNIAYDLDIPIYLIDLASFKDASLHDAWRDIVACAPCLILLEDIDTAFNGRANGTSSATFDQLLNCIDGVQQNSGGVLIMMSTNHIDRLDPALRRPGRMDRIVTFTGLSDEGRFKIARRILDNDELAADVVAQYPESTPAEIQEACFRIALGRMFGGDLKVDDAAGDWGYSEGGGDANSPSAIPRCDLEAEVDRELFRSVGFYDHDWDDRDPPVHLPESEDNS